MIDFISENFPRPVRPDTKRKKAIEPVAPVIKDSEVKDGLSNPFNRQPDKKKRPKIKEPGKGENVDIIV